MFDVDALVEDCRHALEDAVPALAVRDVLDRLVADPRAIDATLGEPTVGGLNTLHHAADLTILQIVWSPKVQLFPHDHRMWAAIGIYGGREDNAFYRRVDAAGSAARAGGSTPLLNAGGKSLDAGETLVLGPDAIHAVTNPLGVHTAAIHIYGGDFFATPRSEWDPSTHEERPFDADHVRELLRAADDAVRAPASTD